MSAVLDTALFWTGLGARVLAINGVRPDGSCRCRPAKPRRPCECPGKHPLYSVCPNGVHGATADPIEASVWFTDNPTANVAVAGASQLADGRYLVGLDVDPRNDGDASLTALEATHGALPPTLRQLSGRGDGGGISWFGSSHPLQACVAAPGIDLLASGKYGVTVGSRHTAGGLYTWDVGAHPEDGTPIADAPAWLSRGTKRPTIAKPGHGDASDTWLGVAFGVIGWLGEPMPRGQRMAVCPFAHEHSDDRGRGRDSSCVLLAPARGYGRDGSFVCSHSHCKDRPLGKILDRLTPDAFAAATRRYPIELELVMTKAA